MTDKSGLYQNRLTNPYFVSGPTAVQSTGQRHAATNATFAGVATINSGASTVTVQNVDVRSESAIFLATQFVTAAASGFGRPLAVTSITAWPTIAVNSGIALSSGTGAFMITTCDSLGVGSTTRVPFMIWRLQ